MPKFSVNKLLPWLLVPLILWIGLRFLLPCVMPFLLAGLLALAAEPLVSSLQRHLKLPRAVAAGIGISISLLLTVLLVVALCALLVRQLGALAGVLPDLENATLSGLNSLKEWLLHLAENAPAGIGSVVSQGVEGMFSNSSTLLNQATSTLLALASTILKGLPDSALGLGTWVLATFMLSVRLPKIRGWISHRLPAAWHGKYLPWLTGLKHSLSGWMLAQLKLMGLTFCILSAGFLLLRISRPILWAALICLVDILPVLGTGTVLIPWSLVCFLQGNRLQSIGLLGIYVVVSLLRSVMEPRLVGKQLGLDPLITLVAIYAGYQLWGLPGILLAPVLAVVVTQFLPKREKPAQNP